MGLTVGNEVLTEGNDVAIKIKELPEKYGIELSEDAIKEYGEQAISKVQIEALRIKETAGERLDTLKGLFGLKAEMAAKSVKDALNRSGKIEAIKQKEGLSSGKEAGEIMAGKFEEMSNTVTKAGNSEAGKKIKAVVSEAKNKIEGVGMIDFFIKQAKSFGGWIGEFIAGVLSFFKLGSFFGDKEEKAKKVADKVLSPEERENTKNEIIKLLSKSFPGKKENIEVLLNNPKKISDKQLSEIYERIKKNKKLSIKDITDILGKNMLRDILPTEKELKEKVEKMKTKIFEGLKHDLEVKLLNTALTKKQEDSLLKTVSEIGINESTIYDLENNFKQDDRISMSNITPLLSSIGLESGKFLIKLIYRGIIPASYIVSDFADTAFDTVKLSIAPLGILENIKINTLESLSLEMSDEEKAIIIMLLYKKGGLIFKTLGYMSETISRVGIDAMTNTTTKSIDILKASFNSDYEKQILNLEKISKSFGGTKGFKGEEMLKLAKSNLDSVINNYKYLNIINQPGVTSERLIKKLTEEGIEGLGKGMSTDAIKEIVHKKFNADFVKGWTQKGGYNLKNIFVGFGGGSDIHDFNQKLERIVDSQKSLLTGTKFGKILGKGLEMVNLPDISRLGDRLVFNFKGPKDVKIFTELLKRSPEMIGGIMGKLPIISIAGLATMQEGNLIENLGKELIYLIPFVGPITMINQGALSGIKSGEYNMENMSTMGAGFLLIGIDSIFTFKEIIAGYTKGGLSGSVKGAGSYMIQPIKDIYGIGRGASEFIYIGLKGGPGRLKPLVTKAIEKTKNLKGKVKALAIIALVGIGGLELAFADDSDLKEYFNNDGKLNIEKIKNAELSKDEKLEILKIIFTSSQSIVFQKNIEFNIENNQLVINSSNPNVKGDWIVENNILEILKLNPDIKFNYIA